MSARKWVAVLSVAALLTGQASAESIRLAGFILDAGKARLDHSEALRGASVFAGQQLSTDAGGRLRVQLQHTQIALDGSSTLSVDGGEGELRAVLRRGAMSFAAQSDGAFALSVHGVVIRAGGKQPVHGAVQILSPTELVVTSYHGALAASYAGFTQVIPAGGSYHATLAPPQDPQGAGRRRGVPPIVWVVATAAALSVGLWLASRDNNVSPSAP